MGATFGMNTVRESCRTFRQYLGDLLSANFEQSLTKLRLFVNFCEMDDVLRELARALHARFDVVSWYRTAASQGVDFRFPEESADRLAALYLLIYKLGRREFDQRQVLSEVMPGANIEAKYGAFLGRVVQPFREAVDRVLVGLERAAAGADRVDVGAAVATYLAAETAAMEVPAAAAPARGKAGGRKGGKGGAPITPTPKKKGKAARVTEVVEEEPEPRPKKAAPPPTPAPPPPPAKPAKEGKGAKPSPVPQRYRGAYQALEEALSTAGQKLRKAAREDFALDVRIIGLELGKPEPSLDRVRDILGTLSEARPLAAAAKRFLESIG